VDKLGVATMKPNTMDLAKLRETLELAEKNAAAMGERRTAAMAAGETKNRRKYSVEAAVYRPSKQLLQYLVRKQPRSTVRVRRELLKAFDFVILETCE